MDKVTIELNSAGIQSLLKSDEVKNLCEIYGHAVASKAGSGFEVDTQTGKYRNITRVTAVSPVAKTATLKNNVLLKALKGFNGND